MVKDFHRNTPAGTSPAGATAKSCFWLIPCLLGLYISICLVAAVARSKNRLQQNLLYLCVGTSRRWFVDCRLHIFIIHGALWWFWVYRTILIFFRGFLEGKVCNFVQVNAFYQCFSSTTSLPKICHSRGFHYPSFSDFHSFQIRHSGRKSNAGCKSVLSDRSTSSRWGTWKNLIPTSASPGNLRSGEVSISSSYC